jgi:hypothetical protein
VTATGAAPPATTAAPATPARPAHRVAPPAWRDWRFLLALAATLAVAVFLRLYRLDAVPPGLAYDEAWEGLDALRILGGARPVFLDGNNGREPLFAYSAAPLLAWLGPTPTALRAAAAAWGILTVASMALLGGVLGGRGLALAAAVLVAISYWPLHMSRLGMRSVALPPLEGIAVALLLVALGATLSRPVLPAWRSPWPRRAAAVGAGLFLGLSLYTYLPARLLGGVAGVAVVASVVSAVRRGGVAQRRLVAETTLIAAVVALVVAAPLVRHYLREPSDWLGRAGQVSVLNEIRGGADPRAVLERNARLTLGGLVLRGDDQPRHNLPGRPTFDPVGAVLLALGGLMLLRRLFTVAGITIAAWLAVMMVPALLSDSAPHALRAMGALPPLYLVAGLGLVGLRGLVGRVSPRWAAGAVGAAVAFTCALTARDYFVALPGHPRTAVEFDADLRAIAGYVRARPEPLPAIVGPVEAQHPALRFLAPEHPTETFPVGALPLLPAGERGLEYVFRAGDEVRFTRVRAAYPGAAVAWPGEFPVLRVPAGAQPVVPDVAHRSGARIGPLELIGGDSFPTTGGGELPVRLVWRAAAPVEERLSVFLHLVDATGRAWARESLEPGLGAYPSTGWRAGQIVVDERRLPLPPGVPPGEYTLRVGLTRPDGARLGLADGSGREYAQLPGARVEPGGRLNLWRLELDGPAVELAAGAARVALVGHRVERAAVTAGEPGEVLLLWEGRGPAPGLRAELALIAGQDLVAREAAPVGGARPIDGWIAGEMLQELKSVRVPPTAPAGTADLWLRVLGSGDQALSEPVRLGQVEIVQRPRVFEAPTPRQPLGIRFGDFAELIGYDVDPARLQPGGALPVKLYWRALGSADRNYLLFVHVVDGLDQIRGQVDGPPLGGSAPTRSWVAGEYIVEERTIPIAADAPPGPYRLAVGLYVPDTGERLPAVAPPLGDRALFGNLAIVP